MKIFFTLIFMFMSSICYGGVNFDGTNDEIDCGDVTILDGATACTFSFWVKFDTVTPINVGLCYKLIAGNNASWQVITSDANGDEMMFDVWDGTKRILVRSTDANLAIDTWYHLVYVWHGGNSVSLYRNSIALGENPLVQHNPINISNTATNMYVGSTNGANSLNGMMSELAIWDTNLALSKVQQLTNSKVKGMPLQIQSANLQGYWALDDHPNSDVADSANGLVFKDRSSNSNDGTASGCNAQAEEVLSYP